MQHGPPNCCGTTWSIVKSSPVLNPVPSRCDSSIKYQLNTLVVSRSVAISSPWSRSHARNWLLCQHEAISVHFVDKRLLNLRLKNLNADLEGFP